MPSQDPSQVRPPTPTDISPISNSTPRKLTNSDDISPLSSRLDCQLRSSHQNNSMSPILLRKFQRRSKSTSRLDFSENMSVDNSFNMASENDLLERSKIFIGK